MKLSSIFAKILAGFSIVGLLLIPYSISGQSPAELLDLPSQQDQVGLTVSPAIFEMRIEAGQKKVRTLNVINKENRPLPVTTLVKTLIPYEEELDQSKRAQFDASQWIKVTEPDFILKPGQRRTVKIAVDVPTNAEPGGHYASIQFEVLVPIQTNQQSTIASAPRVASLAFITVPGPIYEALTLPEPVTVRKFTNANPIPMSFPIINHGNIHVLPNTKLVIRLGKEVIEEIKLSPRFVLPNTIRQFMAEWPRSSWMFGRYSVQAEATYGSPTQTIKSKPKYFYVAPWGLIVLIILAGGLVYFMVRTNKRWAQAWQALRGRQPN